MSVERNIRVAHLLPPSKNSEDGSTRPAQEAESFANAMAKDRAAQKMLRAYASLRLMSLQQDPEAFCSTHAREAAFTDEQWAERLWDAQGDKATFIATAGRRIHAPGRLPEPKEGIQEWVGCITILGPGAIKTISGHPYPSFSHKTGAPIAGASHYLIVAMWVRGNYRRQRVGKMLVSAALDWAKTHEGDHDGDHGKRSREEAERSGAGSLVKEGGVNQTGAGHMKAIMLQVRPTNISAKGLYESSGFRVLSDPEGIIDTPEESDIWMVHCC
ncbi:hypothetical protein BKA70DRAFT_1559139 [Coprinopsis sp. MPI-PUGE-AT-0042]|nr:hypothetical protein BKA70DRAFT_1559139 [Coprinopsis sp. MPI-PUGE-AT-0042]